MGPLSWAWAGAWAWSQFRGSMPSSKSDRLVGCSPTRQRSRHHFAVVPRHPELGAGRELVSVSLQLGQVVERVGPVQLAGVDQAHEQVANAGAVAGLVEQGVLAVQDGLLQRALAQVVVQRGTGLAQEQRQLVPVPEHIADRAAERRA